MMAGVTYERQPQTNRIRMLSKIPDSETYSRQDSKFRPIYFLRIHPRTSLPMEWCIPGVAEGTSRPSIEHIRRNSSGAAVIQME